MKSNNALFYTLSAILLLSINPTELFAAKIPARKPASTKNKLSAEQKLKNLQIKLDAKSKVLDARNLELKKLNKDIADLKTAQASNDKIAELSQSIKEENKQISELVKAIQDGKEEIANLRQELKKSQFKVEDKKPEEVLGDCQSNQKTAKLEEQVKSEIKDVKKVIEKVDEKVVVNNEKKESDKIEAKSQKANLASSDNTDTLNLMAQMTSLFSAQMQAQMQIQLQMMSMITQMQNSMMPQQNSLLAPPQIPWTLNNYHDFNSYVGVPSFNDQIGISAQASPWSDYQNPFTLIPLERQPMQQSPLGSAKAPLLAPIKGFDFNAAPATSDNPSFVRNII